MSRYLSVIGDMYTAGVYLCLSVCHKGFDCFPVSRHFPNSVTHPCHIQDFDVSPVFRHLSLKETVARLEVGKVRRLEGWEAGRFPSELRAAGAK